MTFNSLAFVVFLPVVVAAYYLLPHRFRSSWLLLASSFFYAAFIPAYLLVLVALIVVDFFIAIRMENEQDSQKKQWLLIIGIVSNLALLFFFKYLDFASVNIAALAHTIGWNYEPTLLHLLLPLGLSFHTFQSLSYLIEVYRGKFIAERNLITYGLYVMFFPQLVAGPIERPAHLLPELTLPRAFSWNAILEGAKLCLIGFFLKVVIADRAAIIVNAVYHDPSSFSGPAILLAVILFAFQLYGDFAGYTLIARGSATMLGITLVENFRRPYLARTVGEFWQRWHISLSSWLRDYVYDPVIRLHKRVSLRALYTAVIVTFLLSGVWHGAGWNFVFMGLWFGMVIALELATRTLRGEIAERSGLAKRPELRAWLDRARTFGLVLIGWVFFRTPSLTSATALTRGLFEGWEQFLHTFNFFGIPAGEAVLTTLLAVSVIAVEYLMENKQELFAKARSRIAIRSFAYTLVALLILTLGAFRETAFIYFQF